MVLRWWWGVWERVRKGEVAAECVRKDYGVEVVVGGMGEESLRKGEVVAECVREDYGVEVVVGGVGEGYVM